MYQGSPENRFAPDQSSGLSSGAVASLKFSNDSAMIDEVTFLGGPDPLFDRLDECLFRLDVAGFERPVAADSFARSRSSSSLIRAPIVTVFMRAPFRALHVNKR
jgi:hypothetical protein